MFEGDDVVTAKDSSKIPATTCLEAPSQASGPQRQGLAQRRTRLILLAATIGLFGAVSSPALAQIDEPQEPGTGVSEEPEASSEAPPPKYSWDTNLTGDWGGLRNTLSEKGFTVELGYAMEFMANPVGGDDQGQTYVHNVLLGLNFDLDKLIGLPNSKFRIRGSQRSGDSLSKDYIGNAFSVQQLYGGGQTWRLVEVEMDHDLFDGRLNLAYGRLAATNDFLTSPLYCQFVSNAICGQPPAPFFNMPDGITAYPQATWGARARVHPTQDTYLQVGVYDGDPGQEGRDDHGTDFTFGDNGVLILTEAGYKPQQGLLGLPAAYKIGGYYHTGDFNDVAKAQGGGRSSIPPGRRRLIPGQAASTPSSTKCSIAKNQAQHRDYTACSSSLPRRISSKTSSPTSFPAASSTKACLMHGQRTRRPLLSPAVSTATIYAMPKATPMLKSNTRKPFLN